MSATSDNKPCISMFAGTTQEVRDHLANIHDAHVLLLMFDQIGPDERKVLTKNLANLTSSMLDVLLEQRGRTSLERLVEILLPKTPPSPRLLKEAAMLVQARKAVLASGDLLTAADIAHLAGLSVRNPSAQPNKWKKQGQIFAISHGGIDYFPGYGLDRNNGFRPIKYLAKIIEIFAGHKDSWGMAYWFGSVNSFLGGKRPKDLLSSAPDCVIEAAVDEIQPIAHG